MNVYWLEQSEADVPENNDWLSARESDFLKGLRVAKRRADWRLGRWTGKRGLALYSNLSESPAVLAKIEIWPLPSGAPAVYFENQSALLTISLSHRGHRAACAIAPAEVQLGCDLEMIEPHSSAFVADYFAPNEQTMIARTPAAERFRLLALLWSAKESALKALRTGLRLDTRCVIVVPEDVSSSLNAWSPLHVHYTGGRTLHGWWQVADNVVRTVVADPAPASPNPLRIAASSLGRALLKPS